jgi:Ca-activated chloride channel homolog
VLRSVLAIAFAVVLALPAAAGLGESAPSKNRAGNRLYEQSKFDEALAQYRAAQVIAPELNELSFNAGDALFRKGDLENAVREFGKAAASADTALSADASYNAGNALLKMGQAEQAIGAYTAALKRNPNHEDAKHNLELALQLLEQQQQQQQQNQQGQQNQQDQQKQQNQQNQQDQQKQQGQQNQQDQQQSQEQNQGQQEQQDQEQSQGSQQEAGMSKEDAERLLDAVGEKERELQAELHAAQARKRSKVDKDW